MTPSTPGAGRPLAALNTAQWLALKAALDGNDDQRGTAHQVLDAVMPSDWLEPDWELGETGHSAEEIAAMDMARANYEDRCVELRLRFALNVLHRQCDAGRPFDARLLDETGHGLLRVAVSLLELARRRLRGAETEFREGSATSATEAPHEP